MNEHQQSCPGDASNSPTSNHATLDEQVARLTEENSRLTHEVQRLTELWQRDRETMVAIMLRGFPRTQEELQAALAASEPFSAVMCELFPEHSNSA